MLDHPVTVQSAPGRGSLFQVELPETAPLPNVEPIVPAPKPPVSDLNGLQVLCIDNEPKILEGMQTLLSGWGCRVTTAPGAREAIAALKDGGAPDILLVDYHLDEGTGIDAVVRLRWRFGGDIRRS